MLCRLQGGDDLCDASHEVIVDRPLDEQPGVRGTDLAAVGCESSGNDSSGPIQIGVSEDDARGFATQFKGTGTRRSAPTVATRRPVTTEPVKAILATAGWRSSGSPTSEPVPETTLRTPSGSPASVASRPRVSVGDVAEHDRRAATCPLDVPDRCFGAVPVVLGVDGYCHPLGAEREGNSSSDVAARAGDQRGTTSEADARQDHTTSIRSAR